MSANYLGREKGFQNVTGFGEGGTSIAEYFSPADTYPERIDAFFAQIAGLGFKGVDLWTAHCDANWADDRHIGAAKAAAAKNELQIVSLAGGLPNDPAAAEKTIRLCSELGCDTLGMGCSELPKNIEEIEALLAKHSVKLAFENHPHEKSPSDVLHKIGHGKFPHIGVTIDTGWWGTHDYPAEKAIEELREWLLLVHLKNVKEPGTHIAARWDDGCLDLKAIVQQLKKVGYSGWISLEYEPLDIDPSEDCREFLHLATSWWNEA